MRNVKVGRLAFAVGILALWVQPVRVVAQPSDSAPLSAADYLDETKLAERLWVQSPEVLEARTSAGIAASEVTRAYTYPNPGLDLTWGTIPVGRTNPEGLRDPLANVPNYNTGISQLIELAKRGPRQAATVAELERARAQALATLAGRFFELMNTIGHIARSQLRVAVTNELIDASSQLVELDRARASKGDLALMDLDRAEVEHLHLLATREAARTDLEEALATCGAILARPCAPFESMNATRSFIEPAISMELPTTWSSEAEQRRPDIAALDAALRAAHQRETLARRKIIPDVTVRFGYTYDTFVVSGNQRNSLALGLQLPIPVADRGQADRQAAMVTLARAAQTRQSLVDAGRLTLESSARRRLLLGDRRRQLEKALEKARAVQDSVTAALQRGGMSLTEVLLARRAYEELLLDRVDVLGDAYEAAFQARQAAALFPRPVLPAEATTN